MIPLLRAAAARRLRNGLIDAGAFLAIALCAVVSLSFATAAAFRAIEISDGGVIAALALCAFYGLLAAAFAIARRRRLRKASHVATPAVGTAFQSDSLSPLLQALLPNDTPLFQEVIKDIGKLTREASKMEKVAFALVFGFLVGRRIGR